MNARVSRVLSGVLTIASFATFAPTAIAHPRSLPPSLSRQTINRLSRDLTRSPSEDFFWQGRLQLEQEVQLLTQKRQLLTEDLLKVTPDPRPLPGLNERSQPEVKPSK